jgi:hypothetical protein
MKNLPNICEWTYEDLNELTNSETDIFEYKSSKVSLDELKNKISIAASAFWNSGGGIFIAGVDDNGAVDGGIPCCKGRQDIRDWADTAIKQTEPLGEYEIHLIGHDGNAGYIEEGKVVLIIKFKESYIVPHMAYDKKYYIRAGAHSAGANHFQVEALRSLRNFTKPNLRGIMRFHPTKPRTEELVIISINDSVALDVKLTFDPFPLLLKKHFEDEFPLEIAAIDKSNPFRMDMSLFGSRKQAFGEKPVKLIMMYKDVLGNKYRSEQWISPQKNLQPMIIGNDVYLKLVKAIELLANKISNNEN